MEAGFKVELEADITRTKVFVYHGDELIGCKLLDSLDPLASEVNDAAKEVIKEYNHKLKMLPKLKRLEMEVNNG